MTAMKLGAFFLFEKPSPKTGEQVFREVLEQVRWAEELDYDEVWLAQHHFSEYGIASALPVVAAAVARETRRIRIGTAVSILPFQHPIHLAEDWAAVDVLSGGRLDFGVGRGYQPGEFAGFGVPMEEATQRFDESLDIIRLAWTRDRFSYEGKIYKVDELAVHPKPLQKPHPPIYVAALQPASYERVGRMGLGILAAPLITPPEQMQENLNGYRRALRESGGDPDTMEYPIQQMVYVAETNDQARREATPYFEWYFHTISRLITSKEQGPAPASYDFYRKSQEHLERVRMDRIWERRAAAVGDPVRVAEILNDSRRDHGMNHLMAWVGVGGMPHDKVMRSMELLKREVWPRVIAPARAASG